MTIIQIAPMEGTAYHPMQSQSHREVCWEDGFLEVPECLREKVYACRGHCELIIEDGVLNDIVPLADPSENQHKHSAEEDRDSMLLDVTYRVTLLELGVS